jgi:polyketide biosynthesis enoyl-CoA hydratase PksH
MITSYQTIRVRFQDPVCFIQFYRPEDNNTINDLLLTECAQVLQDYRDVATVFVLEGLPEVFCFGADFKAATDTGEKLGPEPLYDLWMQLATGPFISVAHVRGKANAGGIGFVAACDIVVADNSAQFSLSELLFGLLPACVMPFLVRRIGFQKAQYLTLMTRPVSVQQAHAWGLVDAFDGQSDALLRTHLLRLRYLSRQGIQRYKRLMHSLYDLSQARSLAIEANREVFSDKGNLQRIERYVKTGLFPWESEQ